MDKEFKKWLFSDISKLNQNTNKNILDSCFQELLIYFENHPEIIITKDIETFKIEFYNFIYNKYG